MLAVNDLLKDRDSTEVKRVVWIDSKNKLVFLINIQKPSFPTSVELHRIESGLRNLEIEKVQEDPWSISINETELTESENERRDKAWEIINRVNVIPDIFIPQSRSLLIKEASKEFGMSEKSIRRYLKKYWARGMTKNALLPDYNIGNTQKDKERIYTKKPGRPAVYHSVIKRGVVNEKWRKVFKISLEKYYFIRSKPSLKYAYQQMLKEYFSINDKDAEYKTLDISIPIPSFNQFYYYYRKSYKPEYALHKREGRREYLQNYRPIIGSAKEDAMGIGKYAVDATVGDVYLVSEIDRNNVVGRPIIYLVVDVYSRVITGVNVSLENMSDESVRLALAITFENKQEFCKSTLGMKIREDDWPIHFLPHSIIADRGSELISDRLTQIVENLNIKIQNTGSYRPELKSVCEKYFDLLQTFLSPFLPGAVQKDFNKRGGQDYRKKAVLTLKEYFQIVIRCILYYNNHHFMKDYTLTQEMIQENVPPIPIEIFKLGLRQGTGQLRTLTSDQIRANVYPQSEGIVTAKGIQFEGVYYSCSLALKEHWFSRARIHGSWKVNIQYNPLDMSSIYIRIDRFQYEKCSLIEQFEMYRNSTLGDIQTIRHEKRQTERDFEEKDINGSIQLSQEIETIVNKVKEKAKNDSQSSEVPKNIRGIRENRAKELKTTKERINIDSRNHDAESIGFSIEDRLDLFKRKQREVLDHDELY